MLSEQSFQGFGLIVIGNELLDGRVADKHFAHATHHLQARNLALRYTLFLPDDAEVIDAQLRWAFDRPDPFFCCGGIGSTPDDLTRGCAARVMGVPLALHPEGVAILKERFAERATSARLRMVEFPQGCTLIPNPVNRVPGFRVGDGHFLPGFPRMASPMMRWILETWYPEGAAQAVCTLVLPGAKEADLADLMTMFTGQHPNVSFSSLPRFTSNGTEVELGLRGMPETVDRGRKALCASLQAHGIVYRAAGGTSS